LGNNLGYEFAKLLVIIKAAEMLDLVTTPGENVLLTEAGHRFLAADVPRRKAILREKMLALPLFDRLVRVLEADPDKQISIVEFFDYLREWCPRENLPQLARTIIGWGRFAGVLAYSSVAVGLPENSSL
jgi:NitT/TauT family transport system ATP-binding protein